MKLLVRLGLKLIALKSDGEPLHLFSKTLKSKLNKLVLVSKIILHSKVSSMYWDYRKEDLLPGILLKDAQLKDQLETWLH